MTNTFILILIIITLITGIFWFVNKFNFILKRLKNPNVSDMPVFDRCNNPIKKVSAKSNCLELVASIFPVLMIVLIIRSFVYEPFQIPSSSMIPTLLIGDFILVEKFAYGIKDPIYQKTLIEISHPKRGDIVVFKYPGNPSLNYIKRVVGLPGDKITYNPITKEVIIHTSCSSNICKNILPVNYSHVEPSDFMQFFNHLQDGKITSYFSRVPKYENKDYGIRLIERKETLGNVTHRIINVPMIQDQLDMYYQQPGQQLAIWIVPPAHYFMMGDNRDNSSDSRYWGFVPEANLIGKAIAIWISFEKKADQWPTGINLNRIGKIY